MRDTQGFGGEAAAILHVLADDQIGAPVARDAQQVRDHLLRGDVGEHRYHELRELGPRGRHRWKRRPCRVVTGQPVQTGVDVLEPEASNIGRERAGRADGDVVAGFRKRSRHRNEGMEIC
ncbi:MAG: hypothetical protein E6J45_04565 [Chloroflexi bacterium]|nr:MAG: hypothetical protein E6J45_04565 [Chloroflexota bacterium]